MPGPEQNKSHNQQIEEVRKNTQPPFQPTDYTGLKLDNELAEQIKTKSARRIYVAIVHGRVTDEAGIINGAIGRSKIDRQKMAIVEGGKPATTEFRVLERFDRYSLIECRLRTGRTHQIRVHMTSIGYPLAGDPKYGARRNEFAIDGQALHSRELILSHPSTGEQMKFVAPLPADMQSILNQLRS